MYCGKCGKKLEEGTACECEQEIKENVSVLEESKGEPKEQKKQEEKAEQNVQKDEIESNIQKNNSKQGNDKIPGFIKSFGMFFVKPTCTIKEAVQNNSWINALIYVGVFSIIITAIATFSNISTSLKFYNSRIETAQEAYDDAKQSYKNNESTFNALRVEICKKSVEEAKESRTEYLTSSAFIGSIIKNGVKKFLTPLLNVILVVVLLFVMAKVFNGKGKFSQILAGVGLAYNVNYISVILLPLLAKIPNFEKVIVMGSAVTAAYGILIYLVFKNSFEDFDNNKNIFAVFIALAVTTLLSTFIFAI